MTHDIDLIGVDDDIGRDIGITLAALAGFIGLNILSPSVSIGIPLYQLSLFDMFLGIVVISSIIEEVAFRGALYNILAGVFEDLPGENTGKIIATLLTGVAFALYHQSAYADSLESAYIGAFIFNIMAIILMEATGSIVSPIIFHAGVNSYLFMKTFVVVG